MRLITMGLMSCTALVLTARADNGNSQDVSSVQTSDADTSEVDPAVYDPDVAPRAYLDSLHQSDRLAEQQREEEAAKTKANEENWLLNGYEQQIQARDLAKGAGKNTNIYAELGADEDLVKLAGITPIGTVAPDSGDFRTGVADGRATLGLRTDAVVTKPPPHSTTMAFQPLITPLGETEVAGLHNFYASLPVVAAPLASDGTGGIQPLANPSPTLQPTTPSSMDIPGMTAFKSDPTHKTDADWAADDDALPEEKPRHQPLQLELPLATDQERLQKQRDDALNAPGMPPTKIVRAPVNGLPVPPPPDDAAAMVNDPSPIRIHLADPYDILNR